MPYEYDSTPDEFSGSLTEKGYDEYQHDDLGYDGVVAEGEPCEVDDDLPDIADVRTEYAPGALPDEGRAGTARLYENGRESWQANCVAKNFPEGGGPLLPPTPLEEDRAWELFEQSDERNFDVFVSGRAADVQALHVELQTVVSQVHARVREGMELGIHEGYVPAYALERLEVAFTQTAIRPVDQSVLGDDLAVYEQATDVMTIGADAVDYGLEQTITHEIGGHKLSGGTFITRADGTVVRVRRGFVNHDGNAATGSARHYGIDEAVQQHLSLSYLYGQFDVLDPDERTDHDTSYYGHRKLLAQFILRAGGVIDLRAITRGSFEDSSGSGTITTDRRTMVMQASAAYGPGAYHKLSQLFDSMDFDGMSAEELAERIQGPELNADGSVNHHGRIDLEGLSSSFDEFDEYEEEF
ncbi:MAG TPA: hypothetical protein VFM05_14885 [Candidatus Saccharimonadales bacterium]|nr:hypothetical protein [Candidatus Saccharimonadales bacterium]